MNVQRHAQKFRRKVFEQKLVMCPLLDKSFFSLYCISMEKILQAI